MSKTSGVKTPNRTTNISRQEVRLFDAGIATPQQTIAINPQYQSQYIELLSYVQALIGVARTFMLKPYRIMNERYLMIRIQGDKSQFNLTLNITGRIIWPRMPTAKRQYRLYMDMVDYIDSFWFAEYFRRSLGLPMSAQLSPIPVHNHVENANESGH
ncbi:hypothetical protein [Pasteurella testudinis]|uniref:hypothetical protein n=1 Tax=Pasteurella testudinis TaxID=761 RepID=UPI0040597895